jgi:hypothetical protein
LFVDGFIELVDQVGGDFVVHGAETVRVVSEKAASRLTVLSLSRRTFSFQ